MASCVKKVLEKELMVHFKLYWSHFHDVLLYCAHVMIIKFILYLPTSSAAPDRYSLRWKIRFIHFTDHFCSVQCPMWFVWRFKLCDSRSVLLREAVYQSFRLQWVLALPYRSTADTSFYWNNRLKPCLRLFVREKSDKLHVGRTNRLAFWTAHGSESRVGSPVLVGGAADQPYNSQQSSGITNGTWYWLHSLPEWIQ